ncbi:MAG: hypothetical protein ACI4OW_05305 [Alphaproteobacteria bacterium]
MVKIIHYEVYTDRGDGWKLEDRFSSEQRYEAVNLAKEKEQDKIPVKIIREVFDVQDNSYVENVEYISVQNGKNEKDKPLVGNSVSSSENGAPLSGKKENFSENHNLGVALLKLVTIIVLSLLFANVLVSLLVPVIEVFAEGETAKNIMFIVFLGIFLLLAVPLVLKKVPLDVFVSNRMPRTCVLNDKKFLDKADILIRRYNLNDDGKEIVAPAYPEAPLEYKRHIVDFLSQIITNLDSHISMKDDFTKLGVKLVIYGGCLELARYSGLKLSEANSLLNEAFELIEGKNTDLVEFYDAKRTYKDNKIAVFLTGVGAYLMARLINGAPLDDNILKVTFDRWEDLNRMRQDKEEEEQQEVDIVFTCVGNIKTTIRLDEEETPDAQKLLDQAAADVRNIIFNLVSKFRGKNVLEQNEITSVEFNKLNDAIKFTIEVLQDVSVYREENGLSGVEIETKGNILEIQSVEDLNLSPYIEDIFWHTYDNEIIVDDNIKKELAVGKYSVDFLGDKRLNKSNKMVALYKLIY